jgi:hypothetical protein
VDVTNDEIIEAVRRWQSSTFDHPLTCQQDGHHTKLLPVEMDGQVVLQCPACSSVERYIPEVVLKSERHRQGPGE